MSREPYKWGAKAYLASMEVGEERIDDGTFNWRYLACTACSLTRVYGSRFSFSSKGGVNKVKRVL